MLAFWIIGGAGLALVLISMVFDDILDGLFDFDSSGLLSTSAIGGFAGAFGMVGGIAMSIGLGTIAAAGIGLLAGALLAGGMALISRWLHSGITDRTPGPDDLIGATGNVISDIPANGLGTVVIRVEGHSLRLSGRCSQALPAGTPVTVTASLSATSVAVEPLPV